MGGGVCYFLWDRDYSSESCEFTNKINNSETTLIRRLDEYPVFIRYNKALSIVRKVLSKKESSLSELVSTLDPFGLGSAERGHEIKQNGDIALYSSKGKGWISKANIRKGKYLQDVYKVMISKTISEHAGEPGKDGRFKVISKIQVLDKQEVCTFSYFVIGKFMTPEEANNCYRYLSTKFARFLLLQAISSINLSKDKFIFVPTQDFTKCWTDEELYRKYDISDEESQFIDSMIRPMNGDEE